MVVKSNELFITVVVIGVVDVMVVVDVIVVVVVSVVVVVLVLVVMIYCLSNKTPILTQIQRKTQFTQRG